MLALSELERAVLAAIADQAPDHAAALRRQIDRMSVTARDNTGHGFFTRLHVDQGSPLTAPSPLGDVGATVEGVELGMGFLLRLEDGMAAQLEGYTYGEDLTGVDLTGLRFRDVGQRMAR